MDEERADADSQDEQLYDVLIDYLESAERGVAPDPTELLSRYPQFASEIKEFLDNENRLAGLTAPVRWVSQSFLKYPLPGPLSPLVLPALTPPIMPGAVGDYECLAELGRGSAGVVYRARQRTTGREVALKVIAADRVGDAEALARVREAAKAAAALDHPNVVPVYDVGEVDGQLFVAMKPMEGGSLKGRLAEFVADPRLAARLGADVARAVAYAHQRGVFHGGLKPSNIFLDAEGRPLVADFGLAGWADSIEDLIRAGAAPSMPGYLAPEQAAPGPGHGPIAGVTATGDVYGLGAVLYSLLTGRAPFAGPTALVTFEQVRHNPPPTPRSLNPRVEADLETVCLRCLEKDPEHRYGSAAELADDLGRWLAGQPVTARGSTIARFRAPRPELKDYPFVAPPSRTGEVGRLGSYRLLKIVGGGGMGVVFRGEDVDLQRPVAVKVMRAEYAEDPAARVRMLREARLAAALEHENVVTVYHVGEENGVPYLVMQWLKGLSLEELLRRTGALTVPAVVRLGRQIARGLAAAHTHGLLHRDIKPANLWVEFPAPLLPGTEQSAVGEARIKILDFGLARAVADEAHLTHVGMAVGTPAYMAPEQAGGLPVDSRCDLFSLGVVLYRMSTGHLPDRPGRTPSGGNRQRSPRDHNPAVPQGLSDLIMQMLVADPAGRPASASEVADRLRALEDEPTEAAPAPPPAPTPSAGPSWRGRAVLAVAAFIGTLIAGYFLGNAVVRLIAKPAGAAKESPEKPPSTTEPSGP
jgi:serine/threonine protein kinase